MAAFSFLRPDVAQPATARAHPHWPTRDRNSRLFISRLQSNAAGLAILCFVLAETPSGGASDPPRRTGDFGYEPRRRSGKAEFWRDGYRESSCRSIGRWWTHEETRFLRENGFLAVCCLPNKPPRTAA